MGNIAIAKKYSEIGFKFARFYFGDDHFMSEKFRRRIYNLTHNTEDRLKNLEPSKHARAYLDHIAAI